MLSHDGNGYLNQANTDGSFPLFDLVADISAAGIFETDPCQANGGPLNFVCTVRLLRLLSSVTTFTKTKQQCANWPNLSLALASRGLSISIDASAGSDGSSQADLALGDASK